MWGDGYDHETAEADYDARCEEGERAWQRERDERKKVKAQDNGNDDYPEPYQDKYIRLPDPEVYTHRERKSTVEAIAKFEQMFAEKRLQVIVELANIHLTTEKPSYDGGSWHIEVRSTREPNHSPATDQDSEGAAQ